MLAFTVRETETQSLLEHVRKQRSVLIQGPGGIGKSALFEHVAGVLEAETMVVKLERVAPFANFLRDVFNRLFDAWALNACTFLPDDALYSNLKETRTLWMKFHPNNDTKARSLTDSLEKDAARESRAMIVIDDLTGISSTIVDREESGITLAPILFALGAFTVAWRYIARARGGLDAYVLSGILVGVFMVSRLAFSRLLKSRGRS
jgi:energy-coupling factor transporter ATP-binding protein EcfA2